MSKNIITFKSRKQQFNDWLSDVTERNFKSDTNIPTALFLWETKNKDNHFCNNAYFNCELDDLEWFYECHGKYIMERRFDEYLRKNIGDYIQYIE